MSEPSEKEMAAIRKLAKIDSAAGTLCRMWLASKAGRGIRVSADQLEALMSTTRMQEAMWQAIPYDDQ